VLHEAVGSQSGSGVAAAVNDASNPSLLTNVKTLHHRGRFPRRRGGISCGEPVAGRRLRPTAARGRRRRVGPASGCISRFQPVPWPASIAHQIESRRIDDALEMPDLPTRP